MTGPSIPREAVDRGARELAELLNLDLDLLDAPRRQILREEALAVLNVSARLVVAAAYDQRAAELDEKANSVGANRPPEAILGFTQGREIDIYASEAKELRALAADLRAQA